MCWEVKCSHHIPLSLPNISHFLPGRWEERMENKKQYPQCISCQLLVLLSLLFLKWISPYKWRYSCGNLPFLLVAKISLALLIVLSHLSVRCFCRSTSRLFRGTYVPFFAQFQPIHLRLIYFSSDCRQPTPQSLLMGVPITQRVTLWGKIGKMACPYHFLFCSPNPWDICLALPHRMLMKYKVTPSTPPLRSITSFWTFPVSSSGIRYSSRIMLHKP